MTEPRGISLWFDQLAADPPAAATGHDPLALRPSLDGDTQGDVVVVGAGLTGLWTAYYLLEADPSLDVIVVEQEIAGFGASGRNGGWCSALFPTSPEGLARRPGRGAALAMRAAMRDTVVEVGGVAAAEEIECDFTYGGTVTLARTQPQLDTRLGPHPAGPARARTRRGGDRAGCTPGRAHASSAAVAASRRHRPGHSARGRSSGLPRRGRHSCTAAVGTSCRSTP